LVDVLSESDAVAYYVLGGDNEHDPPDLKQCKKDISHNLDRRKKLCLVTLDVGKGTTDLSCILVEEAEDKEESAKPNFLFRIFNSKEDEKKSEPTVNPNRHSVQGKTGKCSGGTQLNYIFASYYDKRL